VSFEVAAGEMVALIGPNGAGKSTCFNVLNGQVQPDSGEIFLNNKNISNFPARDIWRLGVGRTFQIAATFGSLTVRENVAVARAEDAGALLSLVGIPHLADRPCAELAYGDLKRVELAMALANKPRLLLMDEPTAGMAAEERQALMVLVEKLSRQDGIAVLFTEHDMEVVFGHASRVLVLDAGEIIAQGAPEAVRADPRVQEVYLGHA
jgi:branched-chain amino acid transport system ATP-binding protein